MADKTYSAGDLNLTIQTIADDTLKSLDAVIERLKIIEQGLKKMKGSNKKTTDDKKKKQEEDKKKRDDKKKKRDEDKIKKDIKDSKNDINQGILNVVKWTTVLRIGRKLGRAVGDIVQAGSEYTETLNLWQVAMRDNLDMATEFVNKMNKAYGVSSKTVMNAQAVFKNMIGSLGQISDEASYKISESLVQMSVDFSSLYNTSLESAFQKMQSMLAGQVRPIRSAGLDMTETTIYQYYKSIGGTKSTRNLTRTEKQLLAILAVYKQMGKAGALGDMSKTINSFANQARMMTENTVELKTWTGLILKDYLEQAGALTYINASLITMTNIIKAIAKSKGIGQENYIDGLFETTEETNDAIDELQGKLLDFDKFRALNAEDDGGVAIDEKLLEALSDYSSNLNNVNNLAAKLAETWTKIFVTDTGELTGAAQLLLGTLILIGLALGGIIALGVVGALQKFALGFISVSNAASLLNFVLIGGVVLAFVKAVQAFKDGDYWAGIAATAIGVGLVGAIIWMKRAVIIDGIPWLDLFGKTIASGPLIAIIALVSAIAGVCAIINNWADMSAWQKIIGIAGVATTAILGLAMAFGVFHSAWSMGLAAAGIIAGITAIVASVSSAKKDAGKSISFFANGVGDLDGGTLFVAGEMGKTEAVYTGSNGKTNVANVQQMKSAFLGALNDWTNGYLDGELEDMKKINAGASLASGMIYDAVTSEAKRRGEKFAKV